MNKDKARNLLMSLASLSGTEVNKYLEENPYGTEPVDRACMKCGHVEVNDPVHPNAQRRTCPNCKSPSLAHPQALAFLSVQGPRRTA